ncbi:MAG: hypothetical protein M3Q56_11555 [Bacteroidota bacterium]|nr:hypothetical protein [Bacteroidota bacterium]
MKRNEFDLAIIYEHPEWHQLLFDALVKEKVNFTTIDLKNGAMNFDTLPDATLYYNIVSPSAYQRGNQHAIPYAMALCKILDLKGKRVINGSKSNDLEFSKSAQIALLASINVDYPKTIVFNNIDALKVRDDLNFPMILKPEQGGSGARMFLVNSMEELENLLQITPEIWQPDNLLLLQEKLENNPEFGIVRVEFVGKKLLYAMRVVTNGKFNLCPSVVCNPEDGSDGTCEIPIPTDVKPEFFPYLNITNYEKEKASRVFNETGHDIGSVEYLITEDGRQVFYDINANSNLRASIGKAWDIDPLQEVVNFLKEEVIKIAQKA